MASTVIHLAIAKKLREQLDINNEKDFYLGAIAPDISKQIGESKEDSHFLINSPNETPNINLFIKRYPTFKYHDFTLGYFTHLVADVIWNEEFLPKYINGNIITLKNGTSIETTQDEIRKLLYSDYTNLNKLLIDEYDLDLSLFYEEFTPPKIYFREIPVNHLDILINKAGLIIEKKKKKKTYSLNFNEIKDYIDKSCIEILEILKRY